MRIVVNNKFTLSLIPWHDLLDTIAKGQSQRMNKPEPGLLEVPGVTGGGGSRHRIPGMVVCDGLMKVSG